VHRRPIAILASALGAVAAACAAACSPSASPAGAPGDAPPDSGVDLGPAPPYVDAGDLDADKPLVDGGYAVGGADGGVIRADRFVTHVVSFSPGDCAGFGVPKMPGVVLGPPVGAGSLAGSLDVVSLGRLGEIVVSFEPNAIVDGPGPDLIVFENAFWAGGDPERPAADLGEISVSDDGVTWKAFACDPAAGGPPYGGCAGWRPVYSTPSNGISPIDPAASGGEAYDLAGVGLAHARFVKVRDLGAGPSCPAAPPKPNNVGFDLDAVALVHAELP
jgi:hypothetical protein